MKKGWLYLLFSTLLLGYSSTASPVESSEVELPPPAVEKVAQQTQESSVRFLYGSPALFAAVVYEPAPIETIETAALEPENEEAIPQEETAVHEEAPSDTVPEEAAPEIEIEPATEVSEPDTDTSTEESIPPSTPNSTPQTPTIEETPDTEPESSSSSVEPQETPPEETEPSSESPSEPTNELETAPYEEEQQVLEAVISQLPFDAEGHQFFLVKLDATLYQVEIRHSNLQGDVEISNMTGIYQYDLSSGRLSVMDPITGEFN